MLGLAAITAAEWVSAAVVFVFGCCVGSFLNVCIHRLPRGLTITVPSRSFCPRCNVPIRWDDNIPLLSFALLKGKCRNCGQPISWQYPLVEALTGILFTAVYIAHGAGPEPVAGETVIMALTVALLIVASAVDVKFLIIPDEISMFGIVGGLAAGLLLPELHVGGQSHHTFACLTGIRHLDGLIASAVGAAVGGGLVLAAAVAGTLVFRKEAMGAGDAKLMAMVGALMGWKVAVLGFFFAPFFGLLYGIPLLVLKNVHVMPYGPFLSWASVLVIVFRTATCDFLQRYVDVVRSIAGG